MRGGLLPGGQLLQGLLDYGTAPALPRPIGTDPERHFVQRHRLTSDWQKPFIADSRVTDLGKLLSAFVGKATSL